MYLFSDSRGDQFFGTPVINVCNYSAEVKTVGECLNNDWWEFVRYYQSVNSGSYQELWFDIESIESNYKSSERDYHTMDLLVEDLGSPTYFNNSGVVSSSFEQCFKDKFSSCGVYHLAWEYEDYVFVVSVYDWSYSFKIGAIGFLTREMWDNHKWDYDITNEGKGGNHLGKFIELKNKKYKN